jgi:hypothetical protein
MLLAYLTNVILEINIISTIFMNFNYGYTGFTYRLDKAEA